MKNIAKIQFFKVQRVCPSMHNEGYFIRLKSLFGNFYFVEKRLSELLDSEPLHLGIGSDDESMFKHWRDNGLDVVGGYKISALQQSVGFCSLQNVD